jgi:hypothetical protein
MTNHTTAERLQALEQLEAIGYALEYDMDNSAYFIDTNNDGEPIEYDEQPEHIKKLMATYLADAEVYTDLPI